jgi:hypothetical protein
MRSASLWLDTRKLDDLAPLLCFIGTHTTRWLPGSTTKTSARKRSGARQVSTTPASRRRARPRHQSSAHRGLSRVGAAAPIQRAGYLSALQGVGCIAGPPCAQCAIVEYWRRDAFLPQSEFTRLSMMARRSDGPMRPMSFYRGITCENVTIMSTMKRDDWSERHQGAASERLKWPRRRSVPSPIWRMCWRRIPC